MGSRQVLSVTTQEVFSMKKKAHELEDELDGVLGEVDDDEIDDEIEDEDDEEDTPPARPASPVARPVRPVSSAPAPAPSLGEEEEVSAAEFDAAAKKRRDQQVVKDYLQRKKDEETISVDEITELLISGDQDKILNELYHYCTDNSGIKRAKQLLREGKARATARIARISGVVGVMLDELKSENEGKD